MASSCDRTAATPSTRVVPTQDAHGAEYGVVAMPGSDLICGALDPVAIVASSSLALQQYTTPSCWWSEQSGASPRHWQVGRYGGQN